MSTGILFAMIASPARDCLCEFSRAKAGTVSVNAKKVFNSLPNQKAEKRSYDHENMTYNILYEPNGTCYLAVTDCTFNRVQCFAFLEETKKKFASSSRNGPAFVSELRKQMEFYSDPKNDKLANLRANIDEVKGVMVQNIDKIIERGDRIDNVVAKTQELDYQAAKFEKQAVTLKRSMWKKKCVIVSVIVLVVLVLIFIVVLLLCGKGGINFNKCNGHDDHSSSGTVAPTPSP